MARSSRGGDADAFTDVPRRIEFRVPAQAEPISHFTDAVQADGSPLAAGTVRPVAMNVADVLDLTVAEAASAFAGDREVLRVLQPIVDVGLDYVKRKVVEDAESRKALYGRLLYALQGEKDPWKEVTDGADRREYEALTV